ncbi:RNA-binding protein [Candidatus Berkelbacteria bacterium CG10_big_fil_rev_8_21_14_0_10_41_12]|uniref:RNA-binding protein n=1 Tax=Candidatus Berkelbacteria bacterium CG10_big_fil_rev_8_21_14_0_10_41_12 TaxID=1974513 RepID=A0A2M6WWS7_9BACT|nr:MAG: RNA-binding protein [Candidatus Berkelbacteria bacterium CG10_big_fil_rev_8_21_14_0_10_41_12]
MKIEKKIWPEYFDEVKSGKKKFEFRLADFKVKADDILVLREWDPKTKEYTGRKISKKVSYVLKTKDLKFYSQKDVKKYGYQIIQLK